MKKITLSIATVLLVGTITVATASGKTEAKKYNMVNIEKNISQKEIKAYHRDAKDFGIKLIDNPKFGCLNIGYTKADFFEKNTLYGTKRADGNIEAGNKGDFKIYSFVKYFKDGASCVETTYEKGDLRYGKGSIASLMRKRK